METINVMGIDLAKHVFQVHGNDRFGRSVLRKKLKRNEFLPFLAQVPPCLIGLESCGGAHFWAREIRKLGHEVKLIAPQFVKPYVKSNKNDAADAEAIAEAVSRPNQRFVAIKELWQQDIQGLHRVRQRWIKQRTATINEIQGLAAEYGLALPKTETKMRVALSAWMEQEETLSPRARFIFRSLLEELDVLEERIKSLEPQFKLIVQEQPVCKTLQSIPGVGILTATAVVAAAPDPSQFSSGRGFSAWLGLVPRQHSSGGKTLLLGISKRGDSYIRTLLIHGARSALRWAPRRAATDRLSRWALEKQKTRGTNRTIVALANKNARMIWALMKTGGEYRSGTQLAG